jgi:hypothetical protein
MLRVTIATVMVLFAATAGWAQFEHPDLKGGKTVVKNVMILPPTVKIVKSGVKGNEELTEESRLIEGALPSLIGSVLQEHECAVDDKVLAADALEKDADLKYAVADLQKRFDEMFPQLEKRPKDVRKGRFTMGDEVARLNPGGAIDAMVFVRGYGHVNTGGKQFLSAMAGVATYNASVYHIVVVDARSGAVLYYGVAWAGNPTKDPENSKKSIRKSFKEFPGLVKAPENKA